MGYCSGGSHEPLTTEVLQKTWLLVAWRTDILSKIAVGNCGVVYNRKPCSANCHCGKRSIQYMGQEQRLPDAVALPPNSVLSCTGSLCVCTALNASVYCCVCSLLLTDIVWVKSVAAGNGHSCISLHSSTRNLCCALCRHATHR